MAGLREDLQALWRRRDGVPTHCQTFRVMSKTPKGLLLKATLPTGYVSTGGSSSTLPPAVGSEPHGYNGGFAPGPRPATSHSDSVGRRLWTQAQ